MLTRFLTTFLLVALVGGIAQVKLHAEAITHFTNNGLGVTTPANAQAWGPRPGTADNITANDTVFEVFFDYTSGLDTLTNSTSASLAPTTPVVVWEAGGTGDGAALVLDGPDLVFFAGNNSADFISFAHGLSPVTSDVQVVTSIAFNTSGTDDTLAMFVQGTSLGSADVSAASAWAGSNNSAIGQVSSNAIFQDGASAPFLASDAVNFNDGSANQINFAAYDAEKSGFDVNDLLARPIVFSSGFEYSSEPSAADIGNDAANLNGAESQIGTFSGAIPDGRTDGNFNPDLIGFAANSRDGGRLAWVDRPVSDDSFTANLMGLARLEGAVVSFDLATRRTQAGSTAKDYDIVGFDSDGNEAFHLVIDTNNTNPSRRIKVLTDNGATETIDLITTFGGTGTDADLDLPNAGGVPDNLELAHVSLSLFESGYTIDFVRDTRAYTTGVIPYNGSPVNFARIDIEFSGGASGVSSGFFLDNLDVRAFIIPEPATWLLAVLGLFGLGALRRRRRP